MQPYFLICIRQFFSTLHLRFCFGIRHVRVSLITAVISVGVNLYIIFFFAAGGRLNNFGDNRLPVNSDPNKFDLGQFGPRTLLFRFNGLLLAFCLLAGPASIVLEWGYQHVLVSVVYLAAFLTNIA